MVTLLLMAATVCGAIFQLVQNFAMQRVESRMDASLQAAVWDRLLGLPVPFFRDYSAGDLAMRSLSISEMRRILTGSVDLVAARGPLLDLQLRAAVLLQLAARADRHRPHRRDGDSSTAWLGYLDVRYQRDVDGLVGTLSGMLLQFVNGISKLRVSATENRAFAAWAEEFSRRQRVTLQARLVGVGLSVFTTVMPVPRDGRHLLEHRRGCSTSRRLVALDRRRSSRSTRRSRSSRWRRSGSSRPSSRCSRSCRSTSARGRS